MAMRADVLKRFQLTLEISDQNRCAETFQGDEVPIVTQFGRHADELPRRNEQPCYLSAIVARIKVMVRTQNVLQAGAVEEHDETKLAEGGATWPHAMAISVPPRQPSKTRGNSDFPCLPLTRFDVNF